MTQNQNLAELSAAGVSVWLDDLSRDRIRSGNLAELIAGRSVVGVTTNPTIFQGALSKGTAYDSQIRELAARGAGAEEIVRVLTTDDVRAACDVLLPVYEQSGWVDGRVSIEVDPRLAVDPERTIAQAIELWRTVDRPNVFIKIPATEPGLLAITRVLQEGISVNVTLIFSVQRYTQVMAAYLQGINNAKRHGRDLGKIFSVASFFVSRVDTEVDKRLDAIGTPEALELRGKAGIANAQLAYAAYRDIFVDGAHTATYKHLSAAGGTRQRPLWASTGTKNPDYSDTLYVTELVAWNTVNTMPEATLNAVADHGRVHGDTVSGQADRAQEVFDRLTAVGVDLADVFAVLEREGVEKFEKSWQELLAATDKELAGTTSN